VIVLVVAMVGVVPSACIMDYSTFGRFDVDIQLEKVPTNEPGGWVHITGSDENKECAMVCQK